MGGFSAKERKKGFVHSKQASKQGLKRYGTVGNPRVASVEGGGRALWIQRARPLFFSNGTLPVRTFSLPSHPITSYHILSLPILSHHNHIYNHIPIKLSSRSASVRSRRKRKERHCTHWLAFATAARLDPSELEAVPSQQRAFSGMPFKH